MKAFLRNFATVGRNCLGSMQPIVQQEKIMKGSYIRAVAAGIGLMCAVVASHGAAPTPGLYPYSFAGAQSVWDLSGGLPQTQGLRGPNARKLTWHTAGSLLQGVLSNMSADINITQGANGAIKGSGSADYSSNAGDVTMSFTVSGTVANNKAGVATVALKEGFQGTVTDANGKRYKLTGTMNYGLTIDQNTLTMYGPETGNVCAGGQCETFQQLNGGQPQVVSMNIPDYTMNGSWDLDLTVQSVKGTKVVVAATVTLSNGRTLTMTGVGAYTPKTDLTKVTLAGSTLDSKGTQLTLTVQGSDLAIVSMTGKLLGQTPTIK